MEKDYHSINTELKSNELKFTKLKNEFRNLSIILEECLLEIAEKKALIDNLKNEV